MYESCTYIDIPWLFITSHPSNENKMHILKVAFKTFETSGRERNASLTIDKAYAAFIALLFFFSPFAWLPPLIAHSRGNSGRRKLTHVTRGAKGREGAWNSPRERERQPLFPSASSGNRRAQLSPPPRLKGRPEQGCPRPVTLTGRVLAFDEQKHSLGTIINYTIANTWKMIVTWLSNIPKPNTEMFIKG